MINLILKILIKLIDLVFNNFNYYKLNKLVSLFGKNLAS